MCPVCGSKEPASNKARSKGLVSCVTEEKKSIIHWHWLLTPQCPVIKMRVYCLSIYVGTGIWNRHDPADDGGAILVSRCTNSVSTAVRYELICPITSVVRNLEQTSCVRASSRTARSNMCPRGLELEFEVECGTACSMLSSRGRVILDGPTFLTGFAAALRKRVFFKGWYQAVVPTFCLLSHQDLSPTSPFFRLGHERWAERTSTHTSSSRKWYFFLVGMLLTYHNWNCSKPQPGFVSHC